MHATQFVRSLRRTLGGSLDHRGRTSPVLVLLAVVSLVGMLLARQAVAQQGTTVVVDFTNPPGFATIIRAPANQNVPPGSHGYRGDFIAGLSSVYAAGQTEGARIGTVYTMLTGTARPEEFATAGVHVFGIYRLELFGKGSIDAMGSVAVGRPDAKGYLSVVGGTGIYAGATGDCVSEAISPTARRFTCHLR